MYSEEDLSNFQASLSERLAEINTQIVQENKTPQLVPGCGFVVPSNMYWHQYIEKTYYCGKGKSKKLCKRILDNATTDGCHSSSPVSEKWFQGLHNGFMANINKLECATY